jgi:uncharacterized protein involved in outer membrane biogenesis
MALFAALIGPWFVNWNDYKATFEAEAEKIVGRPVQVVGSASATLLPSPSLTFEDVAVGDAGGEPMMTVDRFEITIELMPLLQGQFRITSMRLDRPRMRVAVSDDGQLDWQVRSKASQALDPENVILDRLEIVDGQLDYNDRIGETHLAFEGVNAVVEARSLFGPWRIEGSYLDDGLAVPFRFATGRLLDDGTIRIKSEFSPAGWPLSFAADGIVGNDENGLYYDGTYNLAEIVTTPSSGEGNGGNVFGWRSEGKFRLSRRRLEITQAVLSEGPPERPSTVAGTMTVYLGEKPSFEAHASARQIDLDRSLGRGPTEPVDVSSAVNSMVARLENSFIPPIPGRVFFQVPAIVVGGSVIQDVAFEIRPTIGGWRIISLKAGLPGRATLTARGVLATDFEIGFAGDVELSVDQPALFATWLRGEGQGAGRLLAPFGVAGRAELSPGRFLFEEIDAELGDAAIRGRFAWSEAVAREHRRVLEAELVADRVDFTQLKALVELVAGNDFGSTAVVADSYGIKLSAKTFQFEDVAMHDVAIDAAYADDALTVNRFSIGDLGGANIEVTQGRIEALSGQPRGNLDAQFEAQTLETFTRVAARILPDSALSEWLRTAGTSLAPAFLTASIEAPARTGGADIRAILSGVAASTKLSAAVDVSGSLADWRQGKVGVEIVLDSPNSAELARQSGLEVVDDANPGPVHIEFDAAGTPAEGLNTRLAGEFAGVGVRSQGRTTLSADSPSAYAGSLAAASDDFEPLLAMIGLGIPVAAIGNPARIDGDIELSGAAAQLSMRNSAVSDRLVNGRLSLARTSDEAWTVGGDIHIDAIDLGWLTSLGLGFALQPTDDAEAPWSRAPFGVPGYGDLRGSIAVSSDEIEMAPSFAATSATLNLTFQPNQLAVDLSGSHALGGSMSGGLAIHNVGGNVNLTGSIDLSDATLEELVWSRGGRATATGVIDLSSEFEAAGRSPAALASSLTGGGAIAIRDAEVRYMNPQAARLVIRASDLGQEFTENELRDSFTKQIDGGSFSFDRAEGAFAIAAGVARLKRVTVEGENMIASGDAVLDLTKLTIDSDWTVTFDPGDDRVEGAVPQVGLVFRGPLAVPERIIDVLQFGSYLNIRQEERLLELLSQAEADRLEVDRLNREKRKLREDAERRARKAAEAEAARIAAEAEARREAAEAAARQAADEAERIASEVERKRAEAERAAEGALQANAAHETAIENSARLAAEAERLKEPADEAAGKAAGEAAALAEVEEALRRARDAEAAERAVAEAAATGATESERQQMAAEEVAQAARDARAARDMALREAENLVAEAEQRRLMAEAAATAAADALKARVEAERRTAAAAADAEQRIQAARTAAGDAADNVAASSEAEVAARQAASDATRIADAARERLASARASVDAAKKDVADREAAKQRADEEIARALTAANQALQRDGQPRPETQDAAQGDSAREITDDEAAELRAAVGRAMAAADGPSSALAEARAALTSAENTAAQIKAEVERLEVAETEASEQAAAAITALSAAEERAQTAKANVEALTRAAEEASRRGEAAMAARAAAENEAIRLKEEAESLAREKAAAAQAAAEAGTSYATAEAEVVDAEAEVARLRQLAEQAADKAATAQAALRAAAEKTAGRVAEREARAQGAKKAADDADVAEAQREAATKESERAVAEVEQMRVAADAAARAAAEAEEALRVAVEEAAQIAAKAEEQRLAAEEATREALEVSVPR